MISRQTKVDRKRRKGSVMIEFALLAPLLMLMMAGAADFARVLYHAITVINSSEVGSLFGSQSNVYSVGHTQINHLAELDAGDLEGVSSTSSIYCDCPDGVEVDCQEGFCPGYGLPRLYSRTLVQQTFEPMIPWPGIPNPVVVAKETFIRAQ